MIGFGPERKLLALALHHLRRETNMLSTSHLTVHIEAETTVGSTSDTAGAFSFEREASQ